MSLYEVEVALLDGFTLAYVDEDYTQCYIKYAGGDTVQHTRSLTFEEVETYYQMSNLLVELEQNNINVNILQQQL